MKVDVHVTEEEKNTIPNWEERLKNFQISANRRETDIREKFKLVLHEGGHAWAYKKFCLQPKFFGPHVNIKNGKLSFVQGAVWADRSTLPEWMKGAAAVAGYLAVEILTGRPEAAHVIESDNSSHTVFDLYCGELFIRNAVTESLGELLGASRAYEIEIFGTDEAVMWGVNHYRIFLPGERYHVGVSTTGGHGVLIEFEGTLRLFVNGIEYSPKGKINNGPARLVVPYGPSKKGLRQVVGDWNRAVYATLT
jgi:hypothetical protein